MGRGAWWAAVHGVVKSQTRLSDFTFTFHFHALEKEMATHSSVLAWRTPETGAWWAAVHGVGHDWRDLAAAAALREHLRKSKYIAHSNPYQNPRSFAFLHIPTTCRSSISLTWEEFSHPIHLTLFSLPFSLFHLTPALWMSTHFNPDFQNLTWESFFPSPFLPVILMHLPIAL